MITGGLIHEFMVCKRAAWYSSKRVRFENELMLLGKMLHENSYKGEVKNIFSENISIDFVKKDNGEVWIYEVKKSSKMIQAARMQLLFYLKWLKDRGVDAKGKIVVPREKHVEVVVLTEDANRELQQTISQLEELLSSERPPKPIRKKICEKCSYYELCWV